eukprot:6185488-Pleurochrysis_carterae.AAC.4
MKNAHIASIKGKRMLVAVTVCEGLGDEGRCRLPCIIVDINCLYEAAFSSYGSPSNDLLNGLRRWFHEDSNALDWHAAAIVQAC